MECHFFYDVALQTSIIFGSEICYFNPVKSKPTLGSPREYTRLLGSGFGDWFYTMDCWDDSDGDEYAYFRRRCASTGSVIRGLSYNRYNPDSQTESVGWDTVPYTCTDDGTTIYTNRRGNSYWGKTTGFNNYIESVVNNNVPGLGSSELAYMS